MAEYAHGNTAHPVCAVAARTFISLPPSLGGQARQRAARGAAFREGTRGAGPTSHVTTDGRAGPENGCANCPIAVQYPEFQKRRARRDRKRKERIKAQQVEAAEKLGLADEGGGREL